MTKTLIAFSGGMDTAYLLYKLLSETKDEVTALHLVRDEDTKHKIASPHKNNKHIPALVEELRKIRDFKFITKLVADDDYPPDIMHHWYPYLISYAAPFLNEGIYDRVGTGRTWEQFNQRVVNFIDPFTKLPIRGNPSAFATQRLFDKLVHKGTIWKPLTTHEYHRDFNRWHVFSYLPKEIRKHTFSCDFPNFVDDEAIPCGGCHKCLWDKFTEAVVAQRWTAKQLEDYKLTKAREFGSGSKVAPMRAWLPIVMGEGKIWMDLDTKEKVQEFVEVRPYYSVPANVSKESIWNMNDLSDIANKPIIA